MSQDKFNDIMGTIAKAIADKPVDASLAAFLTANYGPDSQAFKDVEALCREGEAGGWICGREQGGIMGYLKVYYAAPPPDVCRRVAGVP